MVLIRDRRQGFCSHQPFDLGGQTKSERGGRCSVRSPAGAAGRHGLGVRFLVHTVSGYKYDVFISYCGKGSMLRWL
jgi:hypothetical protein